MKLSVVSTLYQSAPYLAEFHRRASAAARTLAGDDYEIILVNDGSPDESLDMATDLVEQDAHVIVVDLSRNFGHHKAMMTGLAHARGERIFLIDSDLEEMPEWLCEFVQQMDRQGSDVVYGVQAVRNDPLTSRVPSILFYKMLRLFTHIDIPSNITTVRIMSRRYLNALLLHRESEIYIAGLWAITGFYQSPRTVTKMHKGKTSYTLSRKLSIFVNSMVSFSSAPLVGIFICGITISFLASLYILWLVINRTLLAHTLSGWTSVMASVWLLGGINVAFIGVIGIYLAKIFSETKRRPYTIVRAVYTRMGETKAAKELPLLREEG